MIRLDSASGQTPYIKKEHKEVEESFEKCRSVEVNNELDHEVTKEMRLNAARKRLTLRLNEMTAPDDNEEILELIEVR